MEGPAIFNLQLTLQIEEHVILLPISKLVEMLNEAIYYGKETPKLVTHFFFKIGQRIVNRLYAISQNTFNRDYVQLYSKNEN